MDNAVLVLNAGSSSLKFALFRPKAAEAWSLATRGIVEAIGTSPRMSARDGAGAAMPTPAPDDTVRDAATALEHVTSWLRATFPGARLVGIGHRVVHGGPRHARPVVVTPEVLAELRAFIPYAPLHQPYNLAPIEAAARGLPAVPQVACFDTGFHRTLPEVARIVPLPREVREGGVQRYGFHGLSYEYIASVLPQLAPQIADERVIIAHLGSGASLCALRGGVSIENTFGFTALDGLCMGTRPGAIDPGVVLYLFQGLRLSAQDVESLLYKKAGLLGLSGISNDMRDLLESSEPSARLAVDYFVYRVAKEVGALAAVLGGVDALVFTAGIGENSPVIRRRICEACAWLGIDLDQTENAAGALRLTRATSAVSAWMIPTNEELMIARHTGRLLGLEADRR
jgi:acetate kinase